MRSISIALSLAALAGCAVAPGVDDPAADPAAPGGTGAMLSVDYLGDSDVVGFRFVVTEVACDAYPDAVLDTELAFNVDLLDAVLPGGIDLVEDSVAPGSRHLGADLFVTLEPGCYDVVAIPASEIDGDDWEPSEDCSTAMAAEVEVLPGQTTHVTLLSQCEGDPIGALDALVLLNHAPALDVDLDEKFNHQCEPVEVCITATDPDDDPVDITLLDDDGAFVIEEGELELVDYEDGHRVWQQCFTVVTEDPGRYDFTALVHDLAPADDDGDLERIEDLIGQDSHATLSFSIFTGWVDEPLCFDDEGELVPADGVVIERYPGCEFLTAEDFYCTDDFGVDEDLQELLCDDEGDLIEEALYPDCD